MYFTALALQAAGTAVVYGEEISGFVVGFLGVSSGGSTGGNGRDWGGRGGRVRLL